VIKRFDPECILIEHGSEDSIVFCPTKARAIAQAILMVADDD
jgi:hypothetical protein